MSPASSEHERDHVDAVVLHALQALPADEVPGVEAQLAACAECRDVLDALRPIVDTLVLWPTDLLRPAASLWPRLAERIAVETGTGPLPPPPRGAAGPDWEEVAPGISCQILATDAESQRVSMLVRLAPGTDYPPHRHGGNEELHLLHGTLVVDDRTLSPGDYIRAEAGTVDRRVWSETGCTCVLITSIRDEIL